MNDQTNARHAGWPELDWAAWGDTADTLHMWTQIVGKTRLALAPLQAQYWNVPLYVTARGLSTSAMPAGNEFLEVEFDFVEHLLLFRLSTGARAQMELRPRTVADFFAEYKQTLAGLDVEVKLWGMPVELKAPMAFAEDTVHASYDAASAHRFWRVLMSADRVLQEFSAGFVGKVSPVHFFWGSFDLAVTRFSGRSAPPRPDADPVQAEAYSQEVISAGFWPGNGGFGQAAFYCYAAPVPEGMAAGKVGPEGAAWNTELGEFVLPYDVVRKAGDPDAALLEFLQTSYVAAAEAAGWERSKLER